jgi:ankyrin repeat protein
MQELYEKEVEEMKKQREEQRITNLQNELMTICRGGNIERARVLIPQLDVNFTIDMGHVTKSPLSVAIANGYLELAELLIVNGADINNQYIYPPILLKLAKYNNVKMVKMLLDNNADVDVSDIEGGTALHYACYNGHEEIVNLLLMNGADINCKDDRGWTPLHVAAQRNQVECIKILLEYGADKNIVDNDGETPIDHCWSDECRGLLTDEIDIKEPEFD